MKTNLIIILFVSLALNAFTQVTFDKGYFINESDQRIDCLIKNIGWKNNPDKIQYKISEMDEVKTVEINDFKEFGILNSLKFIKKIVDIDVSSDELINISKEKEPKYKKVEVFLKVLVEGNATLYYFIGKGVKKYFYSHLDSGIKQLVYKKYKTPTDQIAENNRYKQQLFNNLRCEDISMETYDRLQYKMRILTKYFSDYNTCQTGNSIHYEGNKEKDYFSSHLRLRMNNSSLAIFNSTLTSKDVDFDNNWNFGLGFQMELILPFNRNQWSLSLEPTIQVYKSKQDQDVGNVVGGKLITQVSYGAVEFPLSIRRYFYFPNMKLFANFSSIIAFSPNSNISFRRIDNSYLSGISIKNRPNFALGIGMELLNKFGLEIRYHTSREILGDYFAWHSNFNNLSIILGYRIF